MSCVRATAEGLNPACHAPHRHPSAVRIETVDAEGYAAALDDLARLLVDAVDSGAAVNFLAGLETNDARAWWAARQDEVASGTTLPFLARIGRRLVGVVLLILAPTQNGAHRAEVAKLIVHTDARRRGIGAALLDAAEAHARAMGRWLLVLDTETGSGAERLYAACGWQVTGVVPNFARHTDGSLGAATFFWKDVRETGDGSPRRERPGPDEALGPHDGLESQAALEPHETVAHPRDWAVERP